jgi:WS/DGAT/MGAT family acyltransferase
MVTAPETMAPADSILCTIEADPVLRSTILAIARLDRPPEVARLLATLDDATRALPRLRQRVAEPLWPLVPRRWVADAGFSLRHHVRFVRAGGAGDLRGVLDLAARVAEEAFDPARPRWGVWVVEGLDDGGAAVILKIHHAITDGVGGVSLAMQVFGDGGATDAAGGPPEPDAVPGPERRGRRVPLHPVEAARTVMELAGSLVRVLAPATRPLSPVLRGRSLDRHLDAFEIPLRTLRAVAERVGGTVNDAYLAAVTGGLARYHERLGAPVDRLRATVPVSIRRRGDPAGGNRFVPARLVLPLTGDALARARTAGAVVRAWRAEPAFGAADRVAAALDRLPPPLTVRLFGGMLKNVDVDVVNVPGPQRHLVLAGSTVSRFWAFAPPAGTALSITLLSYLDTACVGVNADCAAVADPHLLGACLREGFDELAAVGRTAPRRRAPARGA